MQLYVSFWINSNIPFSIFLIASNLIQPKFPLALSCINDSGGLKTNKKSNQNKKANKRRSKFMPGPLGLSSHPQAYGLHHPWIALGASPLILVKKLQNTVSPISFLWGDISSDRQMNCLLHKILKQKFIWMSKKCIMLYAYL